MNAFRRVGLSSAALALGSAVLIAAPASAAPAGCTTGYVTLGAGYAWARCTTAAAGQYFRAVATCKAYGPKQEVYIKTRYAQWIWQGATAESKAYCADSDYIILSASAQTS